MIAKTQLNFLDRAIMAVAPGWGAKRQMWRDYQASYQGGIATRLSDPWGQSTSYRFGMEGDRQLKISLRDRARAAYKNNPIACSLIQTETDNVIAEGMTLQARTDSEEFNAEAETWWADWWDKADMRGEYSGFELERMIWSQSRVDGDIGVILVDMGRPVADVPRTSRVQIIPSDRIVNPQATYDPNMYDGVRVDRFGRAVGYNVDDIDERTGKTVSKEILARDFIFLAHRDAPFDVRGITAYSRIFTQLNNLDRYIDGLALAAWMGTVFGLIFKKKNAAKEFGLLGTATNSQGDQQKVVTLENGQIKYIGTDEDVATVQSHQPMAQGPDFIRMMLRIIGLPFDMPIEMVLKDVSQANLSSLRGARQDYYRAARPRQVKFSTRVMDRIYQWRISRAVEDGEFTSKAPEDFWAHEFQPRGWQFTDPIVEAQAALLEIDAGLNSRRGILDSLGRDMERIDEDNGKDALKVHSTYTRDPMQQAQAESVTEDPNSQIKSEMDAYGVAVRAGAITPQTDDEKLFRTKLGLPAMSADAKNAWQEDEGVRRPITLTQPGSVAPAPFGTPPNEENPDAT